MKLKLGFPRFVFLFLMFCCKSHVLAANDAEAIDGGRSPNRQFEVVKVWGPMNDGGNRDLVPHFELQDNSGNTLISELSIPQLQSPFGFLGAFKVLWRPDSRFVAIAVETSKFTIHTLVFSKTGRTFDRVEIPGYNEADWRSEVGVHQLPYAWRKNGDLILDITYDYTKVTEEDKVSEEFSTIHFTGNPPKGYKVKGTKASVDNLK